MEESLVILFALLSIIANLDNNVLFLKAINCGWQLAYSLTRRVTEIKLWILSFPVPHHFKIMKINKKESFSN